MTQKIVLFINFSQNRFYAAEGMGKHIRNEIKRVTDVTHGTLTLPTNAANHETGH